MNDQIKKLLELVQLGELSESEAEYQYLRMMKAETGLFESKINEKPKINPDRVSLQGELSYDYRAIECINKLENPQCRLFIFLPFGFGNGTLSWSWKNAFANQGNIEVWLMGVSDIPDWRQLVDHLVANMEPLCQLPFLVYGHSMGGIIAYECLVELEQRYRLSPVVFMPSSVSPPDIFERYKVLPPVCEIGKDMTMPDCRNILEKSQIILPLKSGIKSLPDVAIRCDLDLVKTYNHKHGKSALSCPILAIQANNDVLTKDPVSISLWKNYTKICFRYEEVEGTHLFFMNPPQSFFRTIKSFLNKGLIDGFLPFQPKTYRLISFETGSEEVHVYPFGINPKGYLIYQKDGKMAAHIWSSSRCFNPNHDVVLETGHDRVSEKLLTYLSYTGEYREHQGIIEHNVLASTDPNFDRDTLYRYYTRHGKNITLTTAPLTTKSFRQSKSSAYSKLTWEEVPDIVNYAGHWLIGSWLLTYYNEDGDSGLGECPAGQLILTQEGYFSLVIVKQNRNRPRYDNLTLASNEELADAILSCFSYCGRFEVLDENTLVFHIENGLFDAESKQIRMQLESLQRRHEIEWLRDEKDKSKVYVRLRQENAKPLQADVVH